MIDGRMGWSGVEWTGMKCKGMNKHGIERQGKVKEKGTAMDKRQNKKKKENNGIERVERSDTEWLGTE